MVIKGGKDFKKKFHNPGGINIGIISQMWEMF